MFRLINFEISKIFKNKKTRIIIIIYVLIIFSVSIMHFISHRKDVFANREQSIQYVKAFSEEDLQSIIRRENNRKRISEIFEKKIKENSEKPLADLDEKYIEISNNFLENIPFTKKMYTQFELTKSIFNKEFCDLYRIGFPDYSNSEADMVNPSIQGEYLSKYYQYLLDNKIEEIFKYEFIGYNFIYYTVKYVFPFALILIPILLCFDIFSKENDMGSFKFLLLQPISRVKAMFSKIIAGIFSSAAIIIVPLIILFIFISVFNGSGDSRFPVLYDDNTYLSVEPVSQTIGRSFDESFNKISGVIQGFDYELGISQYYGYKEEINVYDTPSEKLSWIPIRSFLIVCLPLIFLFIVFSCLISIFISTITQNSTKSLIFSIFIAVIGCTSILLVSKSFTLSRFCPFYYSQVLQILSGMGIQTALSGIIVLGTCCIILFILTVLIFRKRDIRC